MANVQLTKDAIEKLNQEAEYLKGSKRAELQEGIEVAKKLSDAEQTLPIYRKKTTND